MFRSILLLTGALLAIVARAQGSFDIDTYLALKNVSQVAVSPDGELVTYTISAYDLETDGSQSAVWMQPAGGGEPVRMTEAASSSSRPAWSPDNRYLAVLSDRRGSGTQVWLLDRRGGDARQLTEFDQGVRSFAWSPDGARMLLTVKDAADSADEERPNPPPVVIDRLQFKRDYVGYIDRRRTHVYVIDVASREARQVTFGDYDDGGAVWSPDGRHIAFVSNRTDTPDRNRNTDLWRIEVDADEPVPERLTEAEYADSDPQWSPDGRLIAYTSNVSDGLPIYAIPQLAILDTRTGRSRLVESLAEIQAYSHAFSADGRSIFAITEYRGEQQLVEVNVRSGAVRRLIEGEDVVRDFDVSADGHVHAIVSRPESPPDLYALEDGGLRRIGNVNRDLMADVRTGNVEKHSYEAPDGAAIDTFIVFPPGYESGERYPAVLHIHGGPWGQWSFAFNSESQLLAARGYVVIMPNPRGSFGYGQDFTDALTGDWGGIDYGDVMAAVDYAIGRGWVDGDRLAVYGWSYGGYLTNQIITKTGRFKAAISGASETLVAANFGHDEWQRLWIEEFGPPWRAENRAAYDRLSPFYSLDKVTTPTLVVGGAEDWNMPILNSEQLFAVLKYRGVPTELVVYPGQYHSLSVPSYEKDLYERYFDWLERYVRK